MPARKPKPVTRTKALDVAADLTLGRDQRAFLGERRIALLESIDALGSITRAAKAVGMSYKGAWDAVDAMNNLAEAPVVSGTAGGARGGGSRLTEHGRELVRLYRQLETGHRRVVSRLAREQGDPERLTDVLQSIALKTSARNQFRGRVKRIRKGAVNADVALDLGDGVAVTANVTNDAVKELGLARGRDAIALIKASFVILTGADEVRTSAGNVFVGTVKSIVRGPVNSEVKLALGAARTLVAVVSTRGLDDLSLHEGDACRAWVNPSHVLLAVND